MRPILKGSTDQSVVIRIVDSGDGTPETGVEHNTSGIDLWYRREGAAKTSITEAALSALTDAHADGGIEHIGDGYYRLDLPDAAVATGANGVMVGGTVTDMVVIGCYVPLVDFNPYDGVRLGLTALPNVASGNAGAIVTAGTGTGQISVSSGAVIVQSGTGTGQISLASGVADVNVTQFGGSNGTFSSGRPEVNTTHAAGTAWGSGAITAASIASDAITAAKIADGAIDAGAIASDAITAAKIADGAIDAATFASGAITATAIAADAITAAKIADGAIDAATFAAGAINAAAIASDAITDAKVASDVTIASVTGAVGSVTGAVGSVTGSVGSVTGNVGGNVTGSVGSVATGGIVAASFASDAITAAKIASDVGTEFAAAFLAAGDIDGYSLESTLKLCLAALAGKLSGAATTTITIRAADDSKARLTATVDADGNRSAVTLDETG